MANEKHIFIGIGGSGCQTVSQIKEKVYEKRFPDATASKSRLEAMNDSYRFIFIDTDQRDIDEANKRNRATFEYGKVPFISAQTDLVNLGRANPYAVYYEAKSAPRTLINKRILEACSPELSSKIPDQPLAFGAGAFRMKSRIAFAITLADFQTKLQAAISSLNDVKTVGGEDCIIYYWVVGSTLGGTGSGIFNDVLYHLNQIHHQVVGNGDPQLVLTMYMPKVYIDSNATEEKYALNAFGVFSELEAFKAMSFNKDQNVVMHRLAFQNDYSLIDSNKRYCPFYYLIPIDIQTDKGTSLGTTRTMYRNTAEMLFHLHYGKAGATFRSDIDNYMNDIMERNHKDFLVPMGYVSLQKPIEQFNKYMRFRFRKDVLNTWLLSENGKESRIEDAQVPELAKELFKELDLKVPDTIAQRIANSPAYRELLDRLEEQDPNSEELTDALNLDQIASDLESLKTAIENESKSSDKRKEYKGIIKNGIYSLVEKWIRTNGLKFAHDSIVAIHKHMEAEYKKFEMQLGSKGDALKDVEDKLQKLFKDAKERSTLEKIKKNNKEDIQRYKSALEGYIDEYRNFNMEQWAHDLKKEFCTDEKNDELAMVRKRIAGIQEKAKELNRIAIGQYKKLAAELGTASMDVTTVYLPQLTKIADGNGWILDNIFSKLYSIVVDTENGPQEEAVRVKLAEFLDKSIYNTTNDEIKQEIDKCGYKIVTKKYDEKEKKDVDIEETRIFSNTDVDSSSEKIIEDFLSMATMAFDKDVRESKEIMDKWETKKISSFFADLTNEEKDNVRRSLSPALFFSYNSNRIDVIKKEEHVVFVAGNEDLAAEMLGFQKGNPKHRFEKGEDENAALVLKSKYGLSLEDYRIYDSIKMVYEKATFREKYHFHHDFAQFLDKITLDDLPEEVLPQHRTFAKMMMLEKFREETNMFFYKDEYDQESYTNTMYFPVYGTSYKIAQPEAFSINPEDGTIILKLNDNGRELYKEMEGVGIVEQFTAYRDLYYNYRFAEITDAILQAILRQSRSVDGQTITGEAVFKTNYAIKHSELLKDLCEKKKNALNVKEKRLYSILFNVVREEFPKVQSFIK